MRNREIVCMFYTCEGGACAQNSNKACHFRKEMQKCQNYQADASAKPARVDTRKKRKERAERNDFRYDT